MYNMKKIGIVATHTAEGKLSINANYIAYFKKFGFTTLIDPYYDEVKPHEYDLVVLPGGSDVDPHRYNAHFTPHIGMPDRSLESFDVRVLPELMNAGQPIFGICRGMQTLNVVTGGTLHEDIDEPYSTGDGDPVHYVMYKGKELLCSSNHHQAVLDVPHCWEITMRGFKFKRAGQNVIADFSSPLHIEGMRHTSLPIAAVQFHPEKQEWTNQCRELNKVVCEEIIMPLLEQK